ncbi:MAG: thioredoxin domain-containing protein [bacterium]|nr:thioredoxin domain-containing protein [bacterium]
MQKQQKTIFFSVLGVLVLGLIGLGFLQSKEAGPAGTGIYDTFATCLGEKGAAFYGAFWCPHCQAQKKLFGKSQKLLPYVECSTADGQDTTQICKDKKIDGYPTWEFADGSRLNGEVALATLAEKTSCVLPVE